MDQHRLGHLGWRLNTNADRLRAMPVYALTTFTGAFLLFLVQPLVGKDILPWFGGAPAVWTTCLLFFQLLLLAGYAYAHCSARWLKPRSQVVLHLLLLLGAMLLLHNITPSEAWKPTGGANPTLRILGLLLTSIGLPYFVLAATSPLMQHWFSRTSPGVSPFRLYALSNVGSMLALISFPIYFETHFTRPEQARLWGGGLILFSLACGGCAWKRWQAPTVANSVPGKTKSSAAPPAFTDKLLWLALPACATTLLLATTNLMCLEVAVIPFLWVLPLALYLLSFIICFDSPRWYGRRLFAVALVAALAGKGWSLFKGADASSLLELSIYAAGLFVCCMVCHGELYRLRPEPDRLTGYYLMIAAAGALGGLFAAIIAPLIFNNYYEFHWGLLLCSLLFLVCCLRGQGRGSAKKKADDLGCLLKVRTAGAIMVMVGLAALVVELWALSRGQMSPSAKITEANKWRKSEVKTQVEKTRNFYGVLTVNRHADVDSKIQLLELSHGRTLHGMQFTDPKRSRWPTAYYGENSGIGLTLQALPAGHRRIGVIGLGAGTLAAYAQAGDTLRFYEINPAVPRIAAQWFTYLTQCKGKVEVVAGDARLSLEKEPPQHFDLLVIDAFSSDAIPVHLLTREAFTVYERHLNTNGLIAVHISNKHLNLDPVVANLAREFKYQLAIVDSPAPRDQPWILSATWALLARDKMGAELINSAALQRTSRPPLTNSLNIPLWTDDFASLYQIIRSEAVAQVNPAFTDAQGQIALTLYQQGNTAGAIAQFRQALKTLPRSPFLLSNLAFFLATCQEPTLHDLPEATRLAEEACQLTHYQTPAFLSTLGIVYSEAGRFPEAIQMAEKAQALANEMDEQELAQQVQAALDLYRAQRPFHESMRP